MSDDSFDLAAAGLRGDGSELMISVEVLAAKLEQALPGQARVELGTAAYLLGVEGGRVEGFRERQVGGISIKREPLTPDAWIAALTADLRAEAERSAHARAALEELLR